MPGADLRWVILGGHGMLGREFAVRLGASGSALASSEADVRDPEALERAVREADVVVNAAAFTDVDGAESRPDDAFAVNATGAGNAAAAAADVGARFVQISTDYVFDGRATTPYPEDAPMAPLGVYGASKADGERLVRERHPHALVVRTAWLYGVGGRCFPRTILGFAAERDTLAAVDDQTGQPTWAGDVADGVIRLIDADAPAGTYHATNSGQTTWFGFAREVFAEAGLDPARVMPTDSSTFGQVAPRPGYSVLGHDAWRRAGVAPLRDWRSALRAAAAGGVLELG